MYLLHMYRIRTNIGGYNIWRFVEIMDLARLIWQNHSKATRVTIDTLY